MPAPSRYFDFTARAVRQYFGLSQLELAEWLGLSKADVSHLETGRHGISKATAESLPPLLRQLRRPTARHRLPRHWPYPARGSMLLARHDALPA